MKRYQSKEIHVSGLGDFMVKHEGLSTLQIRRSLDQKHIVLEIAEGKKATTFSMTKAELELLKEWLDD